MSKRHGLSCASASDIENLRRAKIHAAHGLLLLHRANESIWKTRAKIWKRINIFLIVTREWTTFCIIKPVSFLFLFGLDSPHNPIFLVENWRERRGCIIEENEPTSIKILISKLTAFNGRDDYWVWVYFNVGKGVFQTRQKLVDFVFWHSM